jgi:hypothetical protein
MTKVRSKVHNNLVLCIRSGAGNKEIWISYTQWTLPNCEERETKRQADMFQRAWPHTCLVARVESSETIVTLKTEGASL